MFSLKGGLVAFDRGRVVRALELVAVGGRMSGTLPPLATAIGSASHRHLSRKASRPAPFADGKSACSGAERGFVRGSDSVRPYQQVAQVLRLGAPI